MALGLKALLSAPWATVIPARGHVVRVGSRGVVWITARCWLNASLASPTLIHVAFGLCCLSRQTVIRAEHRTGLWLLCRHLRPGTGHW